MYIARTTLFRHATSGVSGDPPDGLLRELLSDAGIVLEHATTIVAADRIDITLYLAAGSQSEADMVARLVGASLTARRPDWVCVA